MNSFELLKRFKQLARKAQPKELPDKSSVCKHENISIEEGHWCLDCGEQVQDVELYSTTATNPKQNNAIRCKFKHQTHVKGIRKDLKNYNVTHPEDIILAAEDIFAFFSQYISKTSKPRAFRGMARLAIITACISEAYLRKGTPVDVIEIGKSFRIDSNVILSGNNRVKDAVLKHSKEERIPIVTDRYITPMHTIRSILKNGYSVSQSQLKEIEELHDLVMSKKAFASSKLSSIAVGILFYYMVQENRSINIAEFSSKVCISKDTIKNRAKKVAFLVNRKDLISVIAGY